MNIEAVREYCLTLPLAEECLPFDDTTLVFKVLGKMFAVVSMLRPDVVIVKCEPELAIELRESYADIDAAWHFNKRHWNELHTEPHLRDSFVCEQIRGSYAAVIAMMPRRVVSAHPQVLTVQR